MAMSTKWMALTSLTLLVGCTGALTPRDPGGNRPEIMYAAQVRERKVRRDRTPEQADALAKVRVSLAKARDAWEKELAVEGEDFPFFDFSAPRLAEDRKRLEGSGYEAVFEGTFTTDQAVVAAHYHNPGLAGARRLWRAKLDRLDETSRLDLVLREYSAFARDLRTGAGKMVGRELVEKARPAPGMLELAREAVDREIRIAREDYHIRARDLVRDVRHGVADLLYIDTSLDVTKEILSLVRVFEEVIRVRYEGGEARQASLLRVHVELSRLENRVLTLGERRKVAAAKLSSLLGLGEGGKIGGTKSANLPGLPRDREALMRAALAHRQELVRQAYRVERMTILLELAETRTFPAHTLGLSFFERGLGTREGGDRTKPPFRAKPATDPKVWYGVTQAHLDEVRNLQEGAKRRLEDLKEKTYFSVQRAHSALDTALRLESLYRDSLVAKAAQAYEAALAGYRVGRAGFNDVTDAQRTLLEFRLDHAAAVRDAAKSWADLVREVGAEPGD
jgi:hypothetical protein